ncbi:MAG: UDP-N-acetylmuramoyl-tripeptide--D-alanyl-D-alanine ligase [Planctomycetaceae bacterium]
MEPVLLEDLISAIRGTAFRRPSHPVVHRVCIDSRTLETGDMFWAIPGKTHDGHDFVAQATRQGALASVVSRQRAGAFSGPLIAVDDTIRALGEFARWYRLQREALVVGVTGSVGKTTTREMLHAVLNCRHSGIRSSRNYNNEVGLPLSLLDLHTEHEYGIFELGASRVGDIRQLCEIACPEVGVVTRIGPAHLGSFGTLENIYQGKGELLEALPPHGFAVVAGDDDLMRKMGRRAACQVTYVGESSGNQVRATEVEFQPGRLGFSVDQQRYELAAPARHYLTAALCALAVAREIGMDHATIADGLRGFEGAPARCQVAELGPWTVIDDTYNASPLSMQAACTCLNDWPAPGRRLLVAGDMLELGADAPRCHADFGHCVAATAIDRLLVVGEHADHVASGALQAGMSPYCIADCGDIDALLTVLDCWLEPGDVILVKGSRGMRMERVVEWLKQQASRYGPKAPPRRRAVA